MAFHLFAKKEGEGRDGKREGKKEGGRDRRIREGRGRRHTLQLLGYMNAGANRKLVEIHLMPSSFTNRMQRERRQKRRGGRGGGRGERGEGRGERETYMAAVRQE